MDKLWLCEWEFSPCEKLAMWLCEDSNGDHHYYCENHGCGYDRISIDMLLGRG